MRTDLVQESFRTATGEVEEIADPLDLPRPIRVGRNNKPALAPADEKLVMIEQALGSYRLLKAGPHHALVDSKLFAYLDLAITLVEQGKDVVCVDWRDAMLGRGEVIALSDQESLGGSRAHLSPASVMGGDHVPEVIDPLLIESDPAPRLNVVQRGDRFLDGKLWLVNHNVTVGPAVLETSGNLAEVVQDASQKNDVEAKVRETVAPLGIRLEAQQGNVHGVGEHRYAAVVDVPEGLNRRRFDEGAKQVEELRGVQNRGSLLGGTNYQDRAGPDAKKCNTVPGKTTGPVVPVGRAQRIVLDSPGRRP